MAAGYTYSGPQVIINSMLKHLENDKQFIKAFIRHLDLPKWLREISTVQENAANRLLNALRDDMEQDTTHRVRSVLTILGIEPIVRDRKLKIVMLLSRGNDIAFLYFLYKWFYEIKGKDYYTINEQLLLSFIAHLDMICTLRALDRLLPPAQPRKSIVEKRKRLKKENELKKHKDNIHIEQKRKSQVNLDKKYKKFAPYFNKLVDPLPIGQNNTVKEKLYQSSFGRYELWKDPTYIVPNENNRWYVYYFYRPGRPKRSQSFQRRAMSIVRNQRHNFKFKLDHTNKWDPWYAHQTYEDASPSIVEHELKNLINEKVLKQLNFNTHPPMCQHHRLHCEMEQIRAHEENIKLRDKCLKHFDTETKRKEEIKKRVLERLEMDIKLYKCEFKKASDRIRHGALAYMATCSCGGIDTLIDDGCTCWEEEKASLSDIDKELTCNPDSTKCFPYCLAPDFNYPTSHPNSNRLSGGCNDDLINEGSDIGDKGGLSKSLSPSSSLSTRSKYFRDEEMRHAGGDDIPDGMGDGLHVPQEKPKRICYCKKIPFQDEFQPNDVVTSKLQMKRQNNLVCHTKETCTGKKKRKKRKKPKLIEKRAKSFSAVFADALKIVYPPDIKTEEDHVPIKSTHSTESFFKAPTASSPYTFDYQKIFDWDDFESKAYTIETDNDKECKPTEGFDLEKTIFKSLTENMKNKKITLDDAINKNWRNLVSATMHTHMKNEVDIAQYEKEMMETNPIRFKYNQSYFDPDDRELMDGMLKDALQFLAKQRRYVLAAFPDAHKMPLLREWTYKRFGKEYTHKERLDGYHRAMRIIHSMQNIALVIPLKDEGLTAKTYLDYDCLPFYIKKAKLFKKRFYTIVNEILMETARIFWFSIRAFQYNTEPTKDIFFAYMPSRIRDIHKFRIWQPTEFRDNKLIWSRRWNGSGNQE